MSAATLPAKTLRPLNPEQRSALHLIWQRCQENNGSTTFEVKSELSKLAAKFAGRDLVLKIGTTGLARWEMLPEGTKIAEAEEAARQNRLAVARANRGSNLCIG